MINGALGIAFLLAGLAILAGAKQLALIPKRCQGYYERHPTLARHTAAYRRLLCGEKGISVLAIFWRACGILTIISGISLILTAALHSR